jgi:hypothetical protein
MRVQAQRLAPRAPVTRFPRKHTGQRFIAFRAVAGGRQTPVAQRIPVALDQERAAAMTPGAAADPVMDITRIDVTQAVAERELARPMSKRSGRSSICWVARRSSD